MKTSFVFSGSGGQGIMSAGIMLAQTAIAMGKHATYLPEYGPEQRGGSAKCTVVVSDDPIVSPLPKLCDNLIAMNRQAYEKFCEDVRPGGSLVVNANRVTPDERDDVRVISAPVDDIALSLGDSRAANIVLLGILAGADGAVSRAALEDALRSKFAGKKPEVLEMNLNALARGEELGSQYRK